MSIFSSIGSAIKSARTLTASSSLYGAYNALKQGKDKELTPKKSNINTIPINQTTGSQNNKGNGQPVDISSLAGAGTNSILTEGNSKTALQALNKIHGDLIKLNITVEKISAYTALLARNSILNQAQSSLSNANVVARMNETGNLQQTASQQNSSDENKKENKEGSGLGSTLAGVAEGALEGAAAGGIASTAWKGIKRGATTAFRSARPLVAGPVGAAVATVLAAKEIGEMILDMPDPKTRELFKTLLAKKVISWKFINPTIENVSYLKTLPKEQIAMLIDSGKFEGGHLGTLKQIMKEPIAATRIPAMQQQIKTKIIPPKIDDSGKEIATDQNGVTGKTSDLDVSSTKTATNSILVAGEPVIPNRPLSKKQMAVSEVSIQMGNKLSSEIQAAYDLAKNVGKFNPDEIPVDNSLQEKIPQNIAPDLQTRIIEKPPTNEFNTVESNPEINIPIEKEKSLNFGVVSIKQLNIEELILPDGTGLFSNAEDKKGFFEELGESISQKWSKVKESVKHIFEPGDQRPPGYHEKIEGKAGKPLKEEQKEYYDKMYDSLYKAAKDKGVENPEVIAKLGATQTSLETGYGKHMVGNNAFGIKAKAGGDSVTASTQEFENGKMVTKDQNFRKYDNPEDSAGDYIDFLQNNKRYKDVLAAKNVDEAIAAQAKTGYANDPNYGQKLANINATMDSMQLNHLETAKNDGSIDVGPINKNLETAQKNTASLEKPEKNTTGNILADVQNAQTPIQKAPDSVQENLKQIAEQARKPQQPIVIQQPTQPTQQVQQKPQTAPMLSVRNDEPMLLSMLYSNIRV